MKIDSNNNKYPKKRDITSLNIEDNIGQTKKSILKIKKYYSE